MGRTLLIVDDHASFRGFARSLLEADGFAVTGEACDGESALEEVARLHPEVVLVDVGLPGIDGFEVARRLCEEPRAPIVVLTSSREAAEYGSRLVESPVSGFIPKRELSAEALGKLTAAG